MYKRAFLFNGIGSKPEKLLVNLPPELMDRYRFYLDSAFGRLGLSRDLEKNEAHDSRVAEWIISLICDRVIFEHFISMGIIPDIGAGYSSGIVSISGCFGSVTHEFAQNIIMMNRATMRCLEKNGEKLDMGVIVGFSYNDIEEMFRGRFTSDQLVIGSGNSKFHVMVSGRADAVEKALALSKDEGAIKAFSFGTGIAYHHPLMKAFSQEYVDFCSSVRYKAPDYPILSIFSREIMTKGEQVLRENQLNVYTPIRWDLAIKKLEELGVTEFFDISANGAVSKFTRVSRKCKIYTLNDV
ncbi:MAG: ACP S-malonyltransferase [Ruminococcus sp.]|uniref:acyltransferase domain-containing protein n=1 Tax=Ruminococcus sp. TaxID=41978 RepID=UPI001B23EA76|nr:acyltransferase domain-containing protein [Ruminococcus sp.]MBO7474874.1 ACP S-malonyltransferase [Ruminococcus sp.]